MVHNVAWDLRGVEESIPQKANPIKKHASAYHIALISAQVFHDSLKGFSGPRIIKSSMPLIFFVSLVFS